jgi:lipid-A-disaccharide synthase
MLHYTSGGRSPALPPPTGRDILRRMSGPRIFISVGEHSGDQHAANLIRALQALAPGVETAGLGGPRMAEAGCRLVANTVSLGVIGVAPLFGSFWRYLDALSRADRFLASWRPDVAVTIDNPGFHFLVGSRLRARRVPSLWYIPPQLWAWAPWRVRKLRRRFTRVACVLPHEAEFFRANGVPVTFVGHPAVERLKAHVLDSAFIGTLRRTSRERLVALLPGSRRQEVVPILARQLVVARALAARHPPCSFALALAAEEHRPLVAPLVRAAGNLAIRTVVGKTHEVQSAADLALTKSGTTTLELAFYETPMAVFYNISWADWNLIARWLVTTPYLALPNALAGRRIVPEYMYNTMPDDAVIEECSRLLVDDRLRADVKTALAEIHHRIDRTGTSENTAREVLALVGTSVPPRPRLRWGLAM